MENTVFHRKEIREIFKGFVVVELHTDGAERIGPGVRDKNAERQSTLAQSTALPQYVVLNPHDATVMNKWGWENADAKQWKRLLTEALDRWKSIKK